MSSGVQPTNLDRRVAEICKVAELGQEASGLAQPGIRPRDYVELLVHREHFPDAVRFLAHALPKPAAVWWAWRCAKETAGSQPAPQIQAALDATERWLREPTDGNRRAAMRMAEWADFGTAAGCAALAVFFSGDSVSPPDAPPVPPAQYMAAKAVAGGVTIAAVSEHPEKAPETFRRFVEHGLQAADHVGVWAIRDQLAPGDVRG